ncbi:MAG: phosphatidate cytidylyltransferase [Micrococcales bacterium]|nr:phosphatidate cytidylyltransferase [Micrococcales bacterium]MCL2666878.1 phosphatidate cytidylyltransferase [Micrococcales bacterium]
MSTTTTTQTGRDLPVAITVGVGLLVLIGASLYIVKEVFALVAIIGVCAAMWELALALRRKDIHIPVVPLLVGSVGMIVSSYIAGAEALFVAFLLTVGGAVVWRVLDGSGEPALRDATASVFAAAWLPFLAGFAMLMLQPLDGADRVMLFILVTVASDTGGYAVGSLLGSHPLAPKVSPGKTWEGLAGSLVLACVIGVVGTSPGIPGLMSTEPQVGVFLGVAVVITATLGDLAESMLKRDLGLKDMGRLVPGHGGLLDRLDSLLLAAPAAYLVLHQLVPPVL